MTTIYDIAEKAGVSIATVSRVLNNHPYVKESTRRRVEKYLAETGYVPNYNASSLVRKTTRTIAVILPDITNNFFATMFHGIEKKANEHGFVVIFGNTNEDRAQEEEYIRMFVERRVDGILLDPVSITSDCLRPVLKNGIPLVLIDREIKGVGLSCVSSNNEEGAAQLVNHLIALGHRRIGLITASKGISVFKRRKKGYLAALAKAGLEVHEEYIKIGEKPTKEVGYVLAQALGKEGSPPTALFATNNFLAIGATNGLRDLGFRVPEDIAIVCFDELDDGSVLNPFFTSMNQPAYEMGFRAMDLLLKQMKKKSCEPRKIYLDSDLFIRHST